MKSLLGGIVSLTLAGLFWLLPIVAAIALITGETMLVQNAILYWLCDLILIGIVVVFAG